MKSEIKKLEKQARKLEPSAKNRRKLLQKAVRYGEDFLDELPDKPAYVASESMGKGVYDLPINDEPKDIDTLLQLLDSQVDRPGLNPASGKHLGYIPGGGVYPSSIADYLAAITNRFLDTGIGSDSYAIIELKIFTGPLYIRLVKCITVW